MAIEIFARSASRMADFETAAKIGALPMMIYRHQGYA